MKVAVPLAKNILASLGITAGALAIDAGIQKKMHDSGATTLIISNKEDFDILLKGVTKTIEIEKKEQKEGFLIMLLGTLGATHKHYSKLVPSQQTFLLMKTS